jgi:hypothetical protein
MGTTLNRRPISQQSFATLNNASSPFAPMQQQQPAPQQPGQVTLTGQPKLPTVLGNRGPNLPGFRQLPMVGIHRG